jgi:aerobic C4-dicarboxylate transport protein
MKKHPALYFQVIIAFVIATIFGIIFPERAQLMKPIGDAFIKLIKMCIPVIIFCTITSSFTSDNEIRVGRLFLKSLIYFEIITTVAMIFGISVAMFFSLGSELNIDVSTLDSSAISQYQKPKNNYTQFLLGIIPDTLIQAFVSGEILPAMLVSILSGFALLSIKKSAKNITILIEEISIFTFKLIEILIKLAPIGVFGAMSYTVGKYGFTSLLSLLKFTAFFYTSCVIFILLVFGTILKLCNVSIFKLLKHIREEIFVVLGTSSSETVLPNMLKKMQEFGCKKSIVSFVIPAGYAFNLDGTCIYFTMAIIFIANVFHIDLSWLQIFEIIFILLITSKGAAAVVGSAFITLATTLAVIPVIPIEGLVLILGIDRFMSEARAITNLIGNATATIVLDKLEK